MNEKADVKKKAYKLLLQYKLSEITIDNLLFLLDETGYELIEYTPGKNEEANIYLERLNLTNYAERCPAFTYCKGSIKAVFMREDLSVEEKRYALAHEYGHIINGHLERKCSVDGNVSDEQEANEFAHYLLNPNLIIRLRADLYNGKKKVIIAASTVVLIIIAVILLVGKIQSDKYYENYYVTDAGYKYHTKDCPYTKEKGNIRRMTKDEYETGLYSPCQVCIEGYVEG